MTAKPAVERACEVCSARVDARTLQLDLEGRQMCRACHARSLTHRAEETERKHGARRRCARCGGDTLLRHEPFTYGTLSGGGREEPFTVGYHYRCPCGHHCIIGATGGFVLGIFTTALFLVVLLFGGDGEHARVGLVFLGVTVLLVAREAYMRVRNPVR